jgi:pyruvate dehydrogenase (quinone)
LDTSDAQQQNLRLGSSRFFPGRRRGQLGGSHPSRRIRRSSAVGNRSGHLTAADANAGATMTTSDILVETLLDWGATHVFGIVGDGINSIIEALRKRQDRIRYVAVRHEEAAAFMASGWAKHTGGLGVCVGTTGPGAIHLMNGLYDAAFDGAPVVALTGLTFHDLRGVRYQQSVDTVKLMEPLTVYNEEVTGSEHAILIANRACRSAIAAWPTWPSARTYS